jgi:hypothetical protein
VSILDSRPERGIGEAAHKNQKTVPFLLEENINSCIYISSNYQKERDCHV